MLKRLIAISAATMLVATGLTPAVSTAAWTQRGGNAGHSGYVDVSIDFSLLHAAWFSPITVDESFMVDHRGVVSDGQRLYRTTLDGASATGTYDVTAFNLKTGAKLWNFPIASASYDGVSQPVVAEGIVYVNRAGLQSFPGGIYEDSPSIFAFNADTGALLYQSTYDAQFQSSDPPTIAAGTLFAGGGRYGGLYAYDAANGEIAWHFNTPSNNNPLTDHAADESYLYLTNAVRRHDDGTLVRTIGVPSGRYVSSAITNGDGKLLYAASSAGIPQGLALVEAATGGLLWENTLPAGAASGARAFGGAYAVARGGLNSRIVYIVDADNGNLLHTWQNDKALNAYDIVLTNSHAFVRDAERTYAISLSTGLAEWSYPMSGKLAITNGYLVISNSDGIQAFVVPEPLGIQSIAIGFAMIFGVGSRRISRRNLNGEKRR